ncbi:Hypothetical protein PBC10988_27770 [Planctomycetales bacterium 10988]|nr:Hypothetical protein PBC10988_27770 [Planctomycetales bacterium 10988]
MSFGPRKWMPGVTMGWSVVCLVLLSATGLQAETWPGFRGATGQGVAETDTTVLPAKWSENTNLLWKLDLPPRGNSSPVVTEDRIYLTTQLADRSMWVLAIDREEGQLLWEREIGSGVLAADGPANLYVYRHNAATPTVVADEDCVCAFFGTGVIACLDRNGELLWQHDLVKQYGEYKIRFGMGSSPRLWGETIYLPTLTKGASFVIALDKTTGKVRWRKERRYPAVDDGNDAYSTPMILQRPERTEVVVAGADHVNSYNLETGEEYWVSGGFGIDYTKGRIVASPIFSGTILVGTSGNPGGGTLGHMLALDLSKLPKGQISPEKRLWNHRRTSPDSSTPVIYQGLVYLIRNDGIGMCIDLQTGEPYWKQRLCPSEVHASVVAGNGKVYFLNYEGECVVVEAGKEGKVLARNHLPGIFYATPALVNGIIYLRAYETLYAVKELGESE